MKKIIFFLSLLGFVVIAGCIIKTNSPETSSDSVLKVEMSEELANRLVTLIDSAITPEEAPLGKVGQEPQLRTIDLIGSGTFLGLGHGTSTDNVGARVTLPTIFQFPSSTNRLFWNTPFVDYPAGYGATPTAAFLVSRANLVTFDYYYIPTGTDSFFTCEIAVSNDSGCNNPSSTQRTSTGWRSLPVSATTTNLTGGIGGNSTTSFTVTPGTADIPVADAFTIGDINYQCMMLTCFNSSTTDDSTLHLRATLKE